MRLSSLVFVLIFAVVTHVGVASTPPDIDPNYYAQFGSGRDECRRACHQVLASKMDLSINISRLRTLSDLLSNKVNPKGAVFSLSEEDNSVQLRYEGTVDGRKFSSDVRELYERKQMVCAFLPGRSAEGFFVVGTTDEERVAQLIREACHASREKRKKAALSSTRRVRVSGLARVRANGSLSPRGQ